MDKNFVEKLKNLHMEAFGDSRAYADFFFGARFRQDNSFFCIENNQPIAAVYGRILRLSFGKKAFSVPFLTGVATKREHRGRGIASRLVNQAAQAFTQYGYPLVLLHPFNVEFYQRLHFEPISYAQKFLVQFDSRLAQISVKDIDINDADYLYKAYSDHVQHADFFVKRSVHDFADIIKCHTCDADKGYIIRKNGIPKGYVLCDGKKIVECIIDDISMLNAIPQLDGFEGITISQSPTESAVPYGMGRVLNPQRLISLMPIREGASGLFKLSVMGNGIIVSVENGKVLSVKSTDLPVDFCLSDNQLIQILLASKQCLSKLNQAARDFASIFLPLNLVMYEKY